jgi:hypothetical protein
MNEPDGTRRSELPMRFRFCIMSSSVWAVCFFGALINGRPAAYAMALAAIFTAGGALSVAAYYAVSRGRYSTFGFFEPVQKLLREFWTWADGVVPLWANIVASQLKGFEFGR